MAVTLSVCRMSDRYWNTRPLGPTLAGLTLEGILGDIMVVVEVWRRACGRDLMDPTVTPSPGNFDCWSPPREGDPVLGWTVARFGLLDRRPLWDRAVRSMGSGSSWSDCFTCWRCGALDRLWSQVRLCIFRAGSRTHGSRWSHDELSTIRSVIQRGESLPGTLLGRCHPSTH